MPTKSAHVSLDSNLESTCWKRSSALGFLRFSLHVRLCFLIPRRFTSRKFPAKGMVYLPAVLSPRMMKSNAYRSWWYLTPVCGSPRARRPWPGTLLFGGRERWQFHSGMALSTIIRTSPTRVTMMSRATSRFSRLCKIYCQTRRSPSITMATPTLPRMLAFRCSKKKVAPTERRIPRKTFGKKLCRALGYLSCLPVVCW